MSEKQSEGYGLCSICRDVGKLTEGVCAAPICRHVASWPPRRPACYMTKQEGEEWWTNRLRSYQEDKL